LIIKNKIAKFAHNLFVFIARGFFMVRRSISLFIFLSIFSSSLFGLISGSKNDTTVLTKSTKFYYKDNKLDYFEKILIKKLKQVHSKTQQIKRYIDTAFFAIPFIMLSFTDFSSWSLDSSLHTGGAILGLGAGSFLALKVDALLSKILKRKIKNEKIVKTFEMFFEKYKVKIKKNSNELNTKELVPEELHKTFDLLYKDYKKDGVAALEVACLDIYLNIVEKIKYGEKIEKYEAKKKDLNRNKKRKNEQVRNWINLTRK
jgi:hypothetical protein